MIYKNCTNYNNGYLYKEKNVLNKIKQIYFYTNKYFNTNVQQRNVEASSVRELNLELGLI